MGCEAATSTSFPWCSKYRTDFCMKTWNSGNLSSWKMLKNELNIRRFSSEPKLLQDQTLFCSYHLSWDQFSPSYPHIYKSKILNCALKWYHLSALQIHDLKSVTAVKWEEQVKYFILHVTEPSYMFSIYTFSFWQIRYFL